VNVSGLVLSRFIDAGSPLKLPDSEQDEQEAAGELKDASEPKTSKKKTK
jgi:hypothetical protein